MSDTTDLNIIIVLATGYIVYLFYIKNIVKSTQDLKYYKCNPVNLFLQSINADETTGIKNFQTCVSQFNTGIDIKS